MSQVRSKSEVDIADARDGAMGPGPLRPCDAGTLILLDRQGNDYLVLMGRRHVRHAFMPNKFVFPGGRTNRADGRVAIASDLHPHEAAKLTAGTKRTGATRARAIALSAVRETYEEAGLLIGQKGPFASTNPEWQAFAENNVRPALAGLRMIARAITPPGRVRRFDTRFLAVWREEVVLELPGGGPTNELQELVWLTISQAKKADVPDITRSILEELERRLADDPSLSPGGPTPCYRMVRKAFVREML